MKPLLALVPCALIILAAAVLVREDQIKPVRKWQTTAMPRKQTLWDQKSEAEKYLIENPEGYYIKVAREKQRKDVLEHKLVVRGGLTMDQVCDRLEEITPAEWVAWPGHVGPLPSLWAIKARVRVHKMAALAKADWLAKEKAEKKR